MPEPDINGRLLADLAKQVAVLEERITAAQTARDLQAGELARRLEELNHAHRIAQERDRNFVPRELHDQLYEQTAEWRRSVDEQLNKLAGSRSGINAMLATVISIGSFLVAVVTAFVALERIPG